MTTSPKVLYWLGLSVLLSGPVRAGDEAGPPSTRADTTAVSAPAGGELAPGMKSGKTALLLSVLGTVGPAAATLPFIWERSGTSLAKTAAIVGTGAYLFGPSLGHFYSGRPGRAFAGIGLRALAAAGVVIAGFATASEAGANSGQAAVGVAGAVVGGASVIYDIVSAPHSARVHNDEMRRGMHATFGILPVDGLRGIGIRASVAF
jgi:hypothetical protein